jgi:hypothetical protein
MKKIIMMNLVIALNETVLRRKLNIFEKARGYVEMSFYSTSVLSNLIVRLEADSKKSINK